MPTLPARVADFTLTCYNGYAIQSSGTFSVSGVCNACPIGTASSGGLSCNSCEVGLFSNTTSSSQCTFCPAGTISVNAGNAAGVTVATNGLNYIYGVTAGTSCLSCPAGNFQPTIGGQACVPCPPGW